jgi:polyhydroxyalkanoate synthesis regulator phasin
LPLLGLFVKNHTLLLLGDFMKLRIALEEKMYDKRIRDRLLAEGKISKEDIKKYLDKLSDDTNGSTTVDAVEEKESIQ